MKKSAGNLQGEAEGPDDDLPPPPPGEDPPAYCYVECYERVEKSSTGMPNWMHPGWEHRSCHYVELEYAIQVFPGFARGDGKWGEEIYWATKTHSSRVFIPVYVFTAICLFFSFGHHIFGVDGGEGGFVFKGLGVLGLFASYCGISGHLKNRRPITPWATAEYSGGRSG